MRILFPLVASALMSVLVFPAIASAQSPRLYKDRITPTWSADGTKFWYRNRLPDRKTEYILVDAVSGVRSPAFDHELLAKRLADKSGEKFDSQRLPISMMSWADPEDGLLLTVDGRIWLYHETKAELTLLKEKTPADAASRLTARRQTSGPSVSEVHVTIQNKSDSTITMYWVPATGSAVRYQSIAPGKSVRQHSYAGHAWLLKMARDGEASRDIGYLRLREEDDVIVIDQAAIEKNRKAQDETSNGRASRQRRQRSSGRGQASAGNRPRVFVRDHNLWIAKPDQPEQQLSTTGSPKNTFRKDASRARLLQMNYEKKDYSDDTPDVRWSANGEWLVAVQTTVVPERIVSYIHSTPESQLEPLVESYPYAKPGDEIPTPTFHLFDVKTGRQVEIDDTLFSNPWSLQFLKFDPNGSRFWLKYNERGHKVVRLLEVRTSGGAVRTIAENKADTFVHYSDRGKSVMEWLPDGKILWASERSGWNHLYLVDIDAGKVLNPVTQGPWNVKRIESIDRENQQVWFYAVGIAPQQDPYHEHLCRANFDGSGFVQLTDGDGTHDVSFSPDRRFLIDRYSRVDLPPIHELRRATDGSKIVDLEKADAAEFTTTRQLPRRFVAKGRDGQTDIHGIIHFPRDFDPTRSYPVVENIYAGPHDHHVPKAFRTSYRHQHQIADLGFLVVQIDGMGTAWRSKAFHDVCYRNLRDAGFPDRILWMKAAASKFSWMDIQRVGIYGGSAGGQNAMAALLWHGDFYKAAVADCGCHDNRMDKIWWNEQWMGVPEGDHYQQNSNTVHAHRLQGKLMLVVGERDRNVDPASTTQVLKALIDADKDFVFLPVIGAGHGACETRYASRRRAAFLADALLQSP